VKAQHTCLCKRLFHGCIHVELWLHTTQVMPYHDHIRAWARHHLESSATAGGSIGGRQTPAASCGDPEIHLAAQTCVLVG
jgi:hypothetical protein